MALVFALAIAEFDQLRGNTLTHKEPSFHFKKFDDDKIVNLIMPDGGHLYDEDWCSLMLRDLDELDGQTLYGFAYFRNKKDASLRRGADQKAILILSRIPMFNEFLPLLKMGLTRYMDAGDTAVLRAILQEVNSPLRRSPSFQLWESNFCVNPGGDDGGSSSLTDVVKTFKDDTMLLWYAVLLQKKIIVCGQPARIVCSACMSLPYLAGPLHKFYSSAVTPYMSLTDLSPLQSPSYICGTTNILFETKSEWFDVLASFSKSAVTQKCHFRLGTKDRKFIRSVQIGIVENRSEKWVKDQFKHWTVALLRTIHMGELKKEHKKMFSSFAYSPAYKFWFSSSALESVLSGTMTSATETLTTIRAQQPNFDPKLFYSLNAISVDVDIVDQLVEEQAVEICVVALTHPSAQVRKYAVATLANLALTIKGQLKIIAIDAIDRIIERLDDAMPNVSVAAISCIHKVSSSYIGSHLLAIHKHLTPIMVNFALRHDKDLVFRLICVKAIIHIYEFFPDHPKFKIPELVAVISEISDKNLKMSLLHLLDLWKIRLPEWDWKTNAELNANIAGISQGQDIQSKLQAVSFIMQAVTGDRSNLLNFIAANGLQLIFDCFCEINSKADSEEISAECSQLSCSCLNVLTVAADTHCGGQMLVKLNAIPKLLQFVTSKNEDVVLYVLRMIEVVSQQQELGEMLISLKCASSLVQCLTTRQFGHSQAPMVVLRTLGYMTRRVGAAQVNDMDAAMLTLKSIVPSGPQRSQDVHLEKAVRVIINHYHEKTKRFRKEDRGNSSSSDGSASASVHNHNNYYSSSNSQSDSNIQEEEEEEGTQKVHC